jgi:hypothetical protein
MQHHQRCIRRQQTKADLANLAVVGAVIDPCQNGIVENMLGLSEADSMLP